MTSNAVDIFLTISETRSLIFGRMYSSHHHPTDDHQSFYGSQAFIHNPQSYQSHALPALKGIILAILWNY